MWTIPNNHKFGAVAIQNVNSEIRRATVFPNGTVVLTSIEDWIDEQWRRWIGELRAEDLRDCNLIILRHMPSDRPDVLDHEHETLSREANAVLTLIAYDAVPAYESAWSLRGSFVAPRRDVRQMGRLPDFYRTQGSPTRAITAEMIRRADAALPEWVAVRASGEFHRFRLAMGIFLTGLKEAYGEERIHQYARALEGLILPDIGATERQFVHRCLTFAGAKPQSRQALTDIYRLRSATEHLHVWQTPLQQYPEHERETTALLRARQAEKLAGYAVLHVLTTPSVREWFRDNTKIAEFWRLKDHERAAIWGKPFDMAAVE